MEGGKGRGRVGLRRIRDYSSRFISVFYDGTEGVATGRFFRCLSIESTRQEFAP
jgi:hypothetical protein